MKKKYRPFKEARKFVRSLGLKNRQEWRKYSHSRKLPEDIPKSVEVYYRGRGWINMGDWIGTGYIRGDQREFWSFTKSRAYVHSLKLKGEKEIRIFYKSGKFLNASLDKASEEMKEIMLK